jgi:hypothetical protein
LQEASERWIGSQSRLNISAWRQIAIAISRRFCRAHRFEDEQGTLDEQEGWDEDNTARDDPWDLQAGHGSHVAGMIYAREIIEGSDTIIGRRERFREVSQAWHRFLEFASIYHRNSVLGGVKRKRQEYQEELDKGQEQR